MSRFYLQNLQFNNKKARRHPDVINSGLNSNLGQFVKSINILSSNCVFLEPSNITQNEGSSLFCNFSHETAAFMSSCYTVWFLSWRQGEIRENLYGWSNVKVPSNHLPIIRDAPCLVELVKSTVLWHSVVLTGRIKVTVAKAMRRDIQNWGHHQISCHSLKEKKFWCIWETAKTLHWNASFE